MLSKLEPFYQSNRDKRVVDSALRKYSHPVQSTVHKMKSDNVISGDDLSAFGS